MADPFSKSGLPIPKFASGRIYGSQYYDTIGGAASVTTTSTRLTYQPFFVQSAITFTRAYTYNNGAGDNGDTYRTGAYTDSNGSPGTLILDFGEVTLTGASAMRTQTISLNLAPYVGQIIWLCDHANQAAGMYGWNTFLANLPNNQMFGAYSASFSATPSLYVDTAYGALASTAVAPTAGIQAVIKLFLGTP